MKHFIFRFLSSLHMYFSKSADRILMLMYKDQFASCGKKVIFYPTRSEFFYRNISVGDQVYIGPGASFIASVSRIVIGNKVMFGPNVTVRGGDHSTHIIGKALADYKTSDKLKEDDQPVMIEDDVWVGTGAIILKGVTIGRGAIIAAGTVVLKNIPPYAIAAGVPAKIIKFRWSPEDIIRHEEILYTPQKRLSKELIYKVQVNS